MGTADTECPIECRVSETPVTRITLRRITVTAPDCGPFVLHWPVPPLCPATRDGRERRPDTGHCGCGLHVIQTAAG